MRFARGSGAFRHVEQQDENLLTSSNGWSAIVLEDAKSILGGESIIARTRVFELAAVCWKRSAEVFKLSHHTTVFPAEVLWYLR